MKYQNGIDDDADQVRDAISFCSLECIYYRCSDSILKQFKKNFIGKIIIIFNERKKEEDFHSE
jgi:hypothetical protein